MHAQTPSPRRFVVKNPVRGPALSQATAPHSSAPPQFRATPRFSFAASQRGSALNAHQHVVSTPPQFARAGQGSGEATEDVEEDEDRARESIEGPALGGDGDGIPPDGEEDDEGGFIIPPPKRRRLSVEPILSSQPCDGHAFGDVDDTHAHYERENDRQRSIVHEAHDDDDFEDLLSSNQPVSSPLPTAAPTQHRPATQAPRFLMSTPAKPALYTPAPSDSLGTFLKPPRFKPPDEEREAGAEPLPGQFSPHRRGQKFLAGGLAAEVRGWLVDLESHATRSVRNPTVDDGWAVKMDVEEVAGGGGAGMTMVKGRQAGSGGNVAAASLHGVHMILGGGEGMSEGLRKGEQARVGRVLGVKGPVWEVEIEGVRWGLGAAWKVLS